ncbi:universal stress protein [Synergistaceae bacterium OttesenSCG-928-D05]|nr:universal stress protein [Synergistaceae bacterium OttesenSCG-928-D05]
MKVLIAVDFSPIGREVAHAGYQIAQRLGMNPTFFHCAPLTSRFFEGYDIKAFVSPTSRIETDNLKQVATQKLNKVMEDVLSEKGITAGLKIDEHVTVGDAGEEIVEYAKKNKFDLIVIGYKSYSTIERILVGSTASKVARYAPCSVLIYRPED